MPIKTAAELVEACRNATTYKTLYVMGCFGAPMNAANKERYCSNHAYNQQTTRQVMIRSATSDTFGFDCACLIKGLFWGWSGNKNKTYGGAAYGVNGVPDVSADQMIRYCTDVSTDFSDIEPGELLWLSGHVGIYIGGGKAVESTPAWKNGVQITDVLNIRGGTGHRWTKHGKLPWITYSGVKDTAPEPEPEAPKPTTSEPEEVCEVKLPVLNRGDKGKSVKALQALLIGLGGEPARLVTRAGGADGDFGPGTENAVLSYKKSKGLTGGSTVGATTWSYLLGTE